MLFCIISQNLVDDHQQGFFDTGKIVVDLSNFFWYNFQCYEKCKLHRRYRDLHCDRAQLVCADCRPCHTVPFGHRLCDGSDCDAGYPVAHAQRADVRNVPRPLLKRTPMKTTNLELTDDELFTMREALTFRSSSLLKLIQRETTDLRAPSALEALRRGLQERYEAVGALLKKVEDSIEKRFNAPADAFKYNGEPLTTGGRDGYSR